MISYRVAENTRGVLEALELLTSHLKSSAGFGHSLAVCVVALS